MSNGKGKNAFHVAQRGAMRFSDRVLDGPDLQVIDGPKEFGDEERDPDGFPEVDGIWSTRSLVTCHG